MLQLRFYKEGIVDQFMRFYIFEKHPNGETYIAEPLTMRKVEEFEDPGYTLSLPVDEVQGLFQQMWDSGFRPLDMTSATGELQATKYHLEDMRKLIKLK